MKNTITRFLTSTGALLIAFVALQGSAAAQVTVYSDINFEGNSRTFNGDVANLSDLGFNDAISSIQIPQGEQWQFCQDANYGGSCQTLQGSIADLRNINWNDRISSIRVFGRATAVLYRDVEFRGESIVVDRDVPDLAQISARTFRSWDRQISSLAVESDRGRGRARGRF